MGAAGIGDWIGECYLGSGEEVPGQGERLGKGASDVELREERIRTGLRVCWGVW